MQFIRNTATGSQLDTLSTVAIKQASNVLAAVAYVTDSSTLVEHCWKAKKPLTLYARYDYTGPVSQPVLMWFLGRGTQNSDYILRLVPDIFHPKVIWWKEVGLYVGSANLTKRAWGGNVEAGIYLSDEELREADLLPEIESFFEEIASFSSPLTRELADQMIEASSGDHARAETSAQKQFEAKRLIPELPPLISITRKPALSTRRGSFMREWSNTLQYMRDLGTRLAIGRNPAWVPTDVSPGILTDQFLHAYYYNQVRDGTHFPFPALYAQNKNRREAAVTDAISWWASLQDPPTHEDYYIREWAPKNRELLSEPRLRSLSEAEFQELCSHIHACRDHATKMPHSLFGLEHQMQRMSGDECIQEFARWLYSQRSSDGSSPLGVFYFVLYDGLPGDVPNRLFSACNESEKKIQHLGVSMLGELVGWAMPDRFPPRNGRTSKALRALGFDVTVHSGG